MLYPQNKQSIYLSCLILIISIGWIGCASKTPVDQGVWTPRVPEETYRPEIQDPSTFSHAGPIHPQLDMERMLKQKIHMGVYQIVTGDVLELHMPGVLRTLTTDYIDALGQVDNYVCRVNPNGSILLPILGEIKAAGLTLAQLEQRIVNGYYPQFLINPPVVVAAIKENFTSHVSILGAVENPGVYECNSNEMSLVSLIMKAGGIVDGGARSIKIGRAGANANGELKLVDQFVLPVKGLNIPFSDVALNDGDVIEVEKLNPEVFTVIGLVNRSGSFPYPPGVRYNLLQALAFAGGVNDLAAPRYARIYRQTPDGKIVSASFRLKGSTPQDGPSVQVQPGDVVAVEHDFSTRTRLLLAQIFRLTAGVNVYATYNLDTKFDDATTR